ncbi:MAG: hypothetical protein PHT54_04775 [Candidatus Nanoarchaeia archaeon]|nr:hypothetical protein [Candidatus Nanoarchaeia archaeon]
MVSVVILIAVCLGVLGGFLEKLYYLNKEEKDKKKEKQLENEKNSKF